MTSSKMCESCIHHKVCLKDQNIIGEEFVPGNPIFFDNKELYKKYKEWEAKGFPCKDYLNADAVEVRHAKDIGYESSYGWKCVCSLCGCEFGTSKSANYCPNCGAKMDEEDQEQ